MAMINNPLLTVFKGSSGFGFKFQGLTLITIDKDKNLFSFVMPNTNSIKLVGEAMIKLAEDIDKKEGL